MIEARTVAFILIILLIAFIVYRLCLSNERKTKGGFDNLNDVVLAVYDSIEKDTKLEDIDIDIATVKYEVLKTLNLVLEGSNDTDETLKSAFYDTLNDDEKLAFIEALIHSFYVEGYVPSEFIGCDVTKKQVILKARHNYRYGDIVIYLNDLYNKINNVSEYLNTINNKDNKYKISICNSIKAHSVSIYRWGVYEYVEDGNRTMDIDYVDRVDNLLDYSSIPIPDHIRYNRFEDENNVNNISNNPGMLSMNQPRTPDESIKQNNSSLIINQNNEPVHADESNSIYNNLDENNSQNSNIILPTAKLTNNENNLESLDNSNRVDERNSNNNLNNDADDLIAALYNLPNLGEYGN